MNVTLPTSVIPASLTVTTHLEATSVGVTEATQWWLMCAQVIILEIILNITNRDKE